MTTASAISHRVSAPAARRARPRGLDRAVMLVSLAMLRWARRRADRSVLPYDLLTYEERFRIHNEERARQRRESDSLIRVMRIF